MYLQGTVLSEGLGVGRESSSVPAVITGELTLQVRRGRSREGTQELGSVWAIPVVGVLHMIIIPDEYCASKAKPLFEMCLTVSASEEKHFYEPLKDNN
jgi:hypothetical protein